MSEAGPSAGASPAQLAPGDTPPGTSVAAPTDGSDADAAATVIRNASHTAANAARAAAAPHAAPADTSASAIPADCAVLSPDACDASYAEAVMTCIASLIIVLTAPANDGTQPAAERWLVPHMLRALACGADRVSTGGASGAAPTAHNALHIMLRSLDIFLEVSPAGMALFHERGGALVVLHFIQRVLASALAAAGAGQADGIGDDGIVPASYRSVLRVRLS